jgi:hypothetical protein
MLKSLWRIATSRDAGSSPDGMDGKPYVGERQVRFEEGSLETRGKPVARQRPTL